MKKKVLAAAVFLLMTVFALQVTQEILQAKFVQDSTAIVRGFYAEKKNDIDVLFLGSSNCFCTIDPLVLYEEQGIASYNFASSSQSMDISLLYLKEALKRQKPKVVALEVNYLPGQNTLDFGEDSLLWGLTDMPLTADKLSCLYQIFGKVDEEYLSYVFPLLRYHERWKEISKQDYTYPLQNKTNQSKGYLRTDEIFGEEIDLSSYEEEGTSWLDERAVECLAQMADICEKEGIELLLFKSPRAGWYRYFTDEINLLAKDYGVSFLDYNDYVQEIGLNPVMDFRDSTHLNNQGSAKVSSHLGKYLQENFTLPDRREDEKENSWDKAVSYQKRLLLNEGYFAEASNVKECKAMLDGMEDYAAILTYKGGKDRTQYQWIYVEGKPVLSKAWNEDGVMQKKIDNMRVVLVRENKGLQVFINEESYYTPLQNWSVIVYDLQTDKIAAVLGYEE